MHRAFSRLATFLGFVAWIAASPCSGQNCSGTSVGFKPLGELGAGLYQGYQGGFYPNGRNVRPWSHDSAGLALARQIVPLNQSGLPDPLNGKIVLLSIGMSNTTQEFSVFKPLADKDPTKNPRLIIVDGAQGGQTAAIIVDPNQNFWKTVDQRLQSAGVSARQVQAIWFKEADANPTKAFPTHALTLQSEFEIIARILKTNYPNVKLTYCSSRTYAGYATSTLNPEPYAYESGFSVKWLIEKQINGDTSLSYSGPKTRAPWLAWGPYLWVDGTTQRADGFTWSCTDCQSDGTHPSPNGQDKVANLLLNFFKSDSTSIPWFTRASSTSVDGDRGELPLRFTLEQNYPNPFNPSTKIPFSVPKTSRVLLRVLDILGREVANLVDAEKSPGRYIVDWDASGIPSGVYFYRLQAWEISDRRSASFTETRRTVLLR